MVGSNRHLTAIRIPLLSYRLVDRLESGLGKPNGYCGPGQSKLSDIYSVKSLSPLIRVEFLFKHKLETMTEYTFKRFESMKRYTM
ncbi:hypothetical protein YDYSY3_23320 [Paenibacillus chitinolyticus]|nr:hypothetical protein YDYSY3_23320 [Paenibacillus chitinolyticus]